MKFNFKPDKVAFIDFETQSEDPLTTVHKYATHHTTRVLTCVVKVDGEYVTMGPYLDAAHLATLQHIASTHTLVAHNAPFDAAIWEHTLGLSEVEWYDTLPCARAKGYPGSLEALGKLIAGRGKDPNGKRLIDMLCILKPGGRVPAVGPAHKLLMDYNVRDVELLEQVYGVVQGTDEPDIVAVDYAINQRGIPVDREYLLLLIDQYKRNAVALNAEFREATGGVVPTSPKQVKEWLGRQGFKVPDSINKHALAEFLANPDSHYLGDGDDLGDALQLVKEVMEMRREVVRVGGSKAERALQVLEHDDRMREQHVYYGAGTGRWSGRSFQIHNVPHPMDKLAFVRDRRPTDEDVAWAKAETQKNINEEAAKFGYVPRHVATSDILNGLIRGMVRTDNMVVADYGAVEARGLAWVTGCGRMLDIYKDPSRSIYCDVGSRVFGRTITKKGDPDDYTFSKALVLGCGYSMSGRRFEYLCNMRSVDLTSFHRTGKQVSDAVKDYRSTYPEVVTGWKLYQEAVHLAMKGVSTKIGKCFFCMVGRDLHIVLPSGRPIVYRNARVEPMVPLYCKLYGMPLEPVPTVVYDHQRGYKGFLYGGKITENVVQAVCRDLLADTLVKCGQAGLRPFMHVHDEVACEAEDKHLETLLEIMTVGPSWAKGFPLMAEGWSGLIWSKQTRGYRELSAIGGRML